MCWNVREDAEMTKVEVSLSSLPSPLVYDRTYRCTVVLTLYEAEMSENGIMKRQMLNSG